MALLDYLEDEAPQYQPPADFAANNDYKNQPEAVRNALKKRARDEGEAKIAEILGEKPDANPNSNIIRNWNNREKTVRSQFETAYNEAFPTIKAPSRNFGAVLNDFAIDTGNAAANLVKTGVDIVSPTGSVSQAIEGFVKEGQANQSDFKKYQRKELERDQAANSSETGKVAAFGRGVVADPLGLAAEVVGNAGVFGALGKVKTLAQYKNVVATGIGTGFGIGTVRGGIADKIEKTPDAILLESSLDYAKLRETLSEADAKKLLGGEVVRYLPEIATQAAISGALGRFGLEGVLLGAAPKAIQRSIVGRIGGAAAGEFATGASEQISTNKGIQRVLPQQGLLDDALVSGVQEATVGGIAGAFGKASPSASDFTKLDTEAFNASMKDAPTAKAPRQQIANKVSEAIASGKILDPNSQAGRIQANYLAAVKAKGTQNDGTGTGSGTLDGTTESVQTTEYEGADGSPTVLSDLLNQADGIERGDTEPASPAASIFETAAARVDGRTVNTTDGGIADTAQESITATGSTGETTTTGEQRQRTDVTTTNTDATATGGSAQSQGTVSLESLAKYIPNETQAAANLRIKQAVDAGYTIDEVAQAQADSYKATQNPEADTVKFAAQTKAAYIGNDFIRPTAAQIQAVTENGEPAFTESESQMLAGNRMGLSEPIWDKAVTELRKKYESITGKPALTGANNGATKEALAVPVTGSPSIRATDSVGAVDGDKGQVNANPPSNPNPVVAPSVSPAVSSGVSVPDTNLQPNAGSGAVVQDGTEAVQPKAKADLTDPERITTVRKMERQFEREFQKDVKDSIRERLGLVKTKTEKKKLSLFKSWLKNVGIKSSLASDILGEKVMKANSILPFTFRKNGLQIDMLVERAVEDGYLQSEEDGEAKIVEMIQREILGKENISTDYTEEVAAGREELAYREHVETLADNMGLQYSANDSTDSLSARVNRIQTRLEKIRDLRLKNTIANEQSAAKLLQEIDDAGMALIADGAAYNDDAIDPIEAMLELGFTYKEIEAAYNEDQKNNEGISDYIESTRGTSQATPSEAQGTNRQAPSQAEPEALTLQPSTPETNRAQQQQRDAEAQRREQGGDAPLPTRKVTADTPDMFNTQGSVFDQPAEVIIQDEGKDKATTSNDSKLSKVEQKDNEVKYSRTTDTPFDGIEQARTPLGDTKTVTVNGKEYSVFNSDGKPIHGTVEGVRNFVRWFGDSRVTDNGKAMNEGGKPINAGHFTDEDNNFNTFDESTIGSANRFTTLDGFYFGKFKEGFTVSNKRLIGGYLKISNPIIIDVGNSSMDSIDAQAAANGVLNDRGDAEMRSYLEDFEGMSEEEANQQIADWRNADGVILKNTKYDAHTEEYIVFNPNQIKSATSNTGNFDASNPDIQYSFAGISAATANRHNFNTASKALENGANPETVRQETGWFKGADEKWRFEINDSDASLRKGFKFDEYLSKSFSKRGGLTKGEKATLSKLREEHKEANEILFSIKNKDSKEFDNAFEEASLLKTKITNLERLSSGDFTTLGLALQHNALFAAYPELANVRIFLSIDTAAKNLTEGSFDVKRNYISITSRNKDALLSAILHEAQHFIQSVEKFAIGGSPQEIGGYNGYRKLAGEVEARNTEARQKLTAKQRKNTPPESTQDVSPSDVIITFNGNDMQSAPTPANVSSQTTATTPTGNTVSKIRESFKARFGKDANEKLKQVFVVDGAKDVPAGALKSITAYHGSPYRFNKFSLDHLGKGEGAQAYGWGLYFADSKDVAEYYRKALVNNTLLDEVNAKLSALVKTMDADAAIGYRKFKSDVGRNAAKEYDDLINNRSDLIKENNQTYRVNIKADEDTFLLWDKPLSGNVSKTLKQKLFDAVLEINPEWKTDEAQKGNVKRIIDDDFRGKKFGEVYGNVTSWLNGSPKDASEFFKNTGYNGINYPADSMAGSGNKGRNYVVFDDAAVEIVETFYSKTDDNAQAFYNPNTGDIYLIADKIKQGEEIAVLLHEIGHKRLQQAIGTVGMRQLRKGIDAWKDAPEGSNERKVWEAADARAKADGNYDAEIITYAIEGAENLGIEPKTTAPVGTVAKWLASVKAAFNKAFDKLFQGDVPKLTTSDLLDIAKGAAGLELESAPSTTSDGEVLLSRASSIDETLEILKTGKLPDEKRSFTEKQDAIVTSFTDSTRPHDVWTRDLPDQGEAAVLIQAKNLASGREAAFNKEVMDNFGSRVSTAIGAIHKANKDIDFDAAQRLAGDWMSATYAPIANQNLLKKDMQALQEAVTTANELSTEKAELDADRAIINKHIASGNTTLKTVDFIAMLQRREMRLNKQIKALTADINGSSLDVDERREAALFDLEQQFEEAVAAQKDARKSVAATANNADARRELLLIDREVAKLGKRTGNAKAAVTRTKDTVLKRQAAITDKRVIDPSKQKLDIGLAGGYNDATAKQMTTYIEERIDKELLQNVADIVYEMNAWKLQKDIELGKVTKEMAAQFDQSGKYVPLTGDPRSDETASDVFGTGSTNQGKDRAMQGRTSGIAQNGIDASFEQIQKTARYHGWADYKDALHGMYERSIEKYLADGSTQQEAQKKTTEDLGISRSPETMQRPSDDVIIYRKNGKAWVYDLGNKAAIDALRSANVEPIPTAYRYAALATRLMARLVTQFMPGFAPVNALRDTWEKSENIRTRVAVNYPDMDMNKVARTMLGYSLKSLTTLHKSIMPVVAQGTPLEARLKLDANNADQKLMMEFLSDGGASTWGQFLSTDGKDLAEKLGKMHSLPTKAVETLDVWNNSWELISSFSAYKALRENGMDSKAASNMALELMNFRKGGELMKPIKALYMFAQPIASGGHQLLKTLDTRRGKARFAAYAAAGFVLYGLLRSGEDDDELGINRMDNRPNYELERNIIIPYGDAGKSIAIPIGFGLPMLAWTYAVNTAKLTLGKQTAGETAIELIVKTPIKTFAPVAPSESSISKNPWAWLVQTVTPTIGKPIANVALDRTSFGGSLTSSRFEKPDKANALEGRLNTPDFYKDAAKELANVGLDTYPEVVREIIHGYFIGAANVAVKAAIDNPAKEARGKEPVSQFIDRWVKNQDRDDLKQRLYYRYREELNDVGVKASLGKTLDDKQTAMLKILEETKKDETSVRTSKAQATKKFGNGKNPAIYEAELKRVELKQSDIQVKLIRKMNELDAK